LSEVDTKTVNKLKDLARVEEDYSVKLDTEVRGYGNEILREIIESVAIDSKKHAGLYKACAAVLEKNSLSITDVEYEELTKTMEKHITIEANMIKMVDEMITNIKDDRVRMMLQHIKDDEIRHHNLLRNIAKMVVKQELLLEQDVWNQLFRDVLTHGHAGPDQ
jgi:hypothetical protein